MVQPEAMACGLPVTITENSGGVEFVQSNKEGLIIPIKDTEVLKEKYYVIYK